MKRIAKFEKVSLTQFKAGCTREDAEKVYEGIKLPKRATAGSAGSTGHPRRNRRTPEARR